MRIKGNSIVLNSSWNYWIKQYKHFHRYWHGISFEANKKILNFFGIYPESEEFKLGCIALCIIKWKSFPVKKSESACGICLYRAKTNHVMGCTGCKVWILQDIFGHGICFGSNDNFVLTDSLCSTYFLKNMTKVQWKSLITKLYNYYTAEYNKLYSA